MTTKRSGNAVQDTLRNSRMFRENHRWYFRTREGQSIGPFDEEKEAYAQLEVYIRLVEAGLVPAANS